MMRSLHGNAAPLGAVFLVVGAFESSPTLAPCRAKERGSRNNPSGGKARRGPNVGATWQRREDAVRRAKAIAGNRRA